MTAREKYDLMIREDLGPWLRERGFRKRRNRFRRVEPSGWQLVDFQASQWGSRDDVRFTINLWVGVTELADTNADSHVQQRVGALIGDREDHWWPVEPATDMQQLTRVEALTDWSRSLATTRSASRGTPSGASGCS